MKRILSLLLCALMLCASNALAVTVERPHAPVTIYSADLCYKDFTDRLHKIYPEINLEVLSYAGANKTCFMRQSLQTGLIPDIYTTTVFPDAALQKEYLIDLSGNAFINNYTDAGLRSVSVDGGIYLLPSCYNLLGMYYNRTVFEKYGWEVPESFEELLELSADMRAEGIDPFRARMDLGGYIFTYFFGLGNTVYFDTADGMKWMREFPTGGMDAEGHIEPVLEYMREWIDAGFIDAKDIGSGEANVAFMSGQAAMHLCTTYNVKAFDWSVREDHPEYGLQEYGIVPYLSPDGDNNMLITNMQRYYGLSRKLLEPGNEEKLTDALHILEFMSGYEGNVALGVSGMTQLSALSGADIAQDSFYYEVRDVVDEGMLMPYVWTGWEDIINPLAEALHAFVRGEADIAQTCAEFDRIRDDYLENGYPHVAVCRETIDVEAVQRLICIADMKATGADAALISQPAFYGYLRRADSGTYINCENTSVSNSPLFADTLIGQEEINMIRQRGRRLCTAELSGREILALRDKGLKLFEDSVAVFHYRLYTAGDAPIEEDAVYRLVFAEGDVLGLDGDRVTVIDAAETSTYTAIEDYLRTLGEFGKEDIHW